jgi:hypothetical protein
MNKKELSKELRQIAKFIDNGLMNTEDAFNELIKLIHKEYDKDMMTVFQQIRELDLAKDRKEKKILEYGLEQSMENLSIILNYSEEKTKHKMNAEIQFIKSNLPRLIKSAVAYFPEAKLTGRSAANIYFFNKIVELIVNNQDSFKEDCLLKTWADMAGHTDWINKIIEQYGSR